MRREPAGALPRRLHGRAEAVQHRRPGRRPLRREGLPAGADHPADGPRPERAGRGAGRADGARAGRAGAEFAQPLPVTGRTSGRAADLSGAPDRAGAGAGGRDRRGPAGVGTRARSWPRSPARGSTTPASWTPTRSSRWRRLDRPAVAAVAVFLGTTRLIDNLVISIDDWRLMIDGRPAKTAESRVTHLFVNRQSSVTNPQSAIRHGPSAVRPRSQADAGGGERRRAAGVLRVAAPGHGRRGARRRVHPRTNLGGHQPREHPHPGVDLRVPAAGRCRSRWPRRPGRRWANCSRRCRTTTGSICSAGCRRGSRKSVMRLVDEADRRTSPRSFSYGENTVGALMTTDYAWLPATLTAAEAIDQLRQQAPDKETIYYIYVLDEPSRRPDGSLAPRRLLGVVSLRDLILAPRHALVRDLMETELVTLRYDEDEEAVAQLFARYDFIAVPVVDDQFGLLGHRHPRRRARRGAARGDRGLAAAGRASGRSRGTTWRRASGTSGRTARKWLAVLFLLQMFTINAMARFEYGTGARRVPDRVHPAVPVGRRERRVAGGHAGHPGAGPRPDPRSRLAAGVPARTADGGGAGGRARRCSPSPGRTS